LAQDRLVATLSSWLGLLAVILASVGLFGLVSYRAARRTSEIGVRLAFGATRPDVLMMILRESGRLVAIGLAVGIASALSLTRFLSSRLFGVSATDPWTMAGAVVLLTLLAAIAAFVPARRASRLDPMVALRCE
jgi:ABC-type antimicrobial peptide transport system permease subunit